MSEIILNLSENSDNVCLSGEGQMVRGVGRLCRDRQTRVGGSTPVPGSGSVREGQVPLVLLHFSRQHCLTMHFTHTHPGSFIFPPKKAFVLSQCTFNADSFHYSAIFLAFL